MQDVLRIIPDNLFNIFLSLVAAVGFWLLKKLVYRALEAKTRDLHTLFELKNIFYMLFLACFVGTLVLIWLKGFTPLLTVLGLVAAGLTISAKELLLSIIACLVVLWRGLFAIGDRIQIGPYTGDVLQLGVVYFTLMETDAWGTYEQSTGRLVKVPNSMVLTTPLLNASKASGYVWNEVSVLVDPASDWEAAKDIAWDVLRARELRENMDYAHIMSRMNEHYVLSGNLSPTVYTRLRDKGMEITLRYLCPTRMRRDSESMLGEELLRAMSAHGGVKLLF